MDWSRQLVEWVIHFAHTPYGGWALFALAFAESSFFPIPPDVLLIALGVGNPGAGLWLAGVCTLGSVLGGMFGYWLGYKGGRPLVLRFFDRRKVARVEEYYHRWDVWAVGAAGFTPLPYKLFTITAGMFALNFPRFVAASVVSRGARFFLVGGLLWGFGPQIQQFITRYMGLITVGFFVLLVGGFYVVGMGARRASKEDGGD